MRLRMPQQRTRGCPDSCCHSVTAGVPTAAADDNTSHNVNERRQNGHLPATGDSFFKMHHRDFHCKTRRRILILCHQTMECRAKWLPYKLLAFFFRRNLTGPSKITLRSAMFWRTLVFKSSDSKTARPAIG